MSDFEDKLTRALLVSYLQTYGNTKESDLIEHGVSLFSLPEDKTKQMVESMVTEGKVKRVIQGKTKPEAIYISYENL
jgi:hypothetical protein